MPQHEERVMKKKLIKALKIFLLILVVLLSGAYVFLSSPEVLKSKDIEWVTESLIAHRGLHSETVPENTMAAFEAAVAGGYIIECDAQLTKDNQVVILHDDDLNRMFGLDKKIEEVTYAELQNYTILGTDQKVPLLSEVLAMVDDRVPILVEVKNDLAVGLLEGAMFEVLKDYDGRFAVTAFNPYSLEWFKNNAPDMIRGQVSGHFKQSPEEIARGDKPLVWYKKFMLTNLLMNFTSKPNFIIYEVKDTSIFRIMSIKMMNVPLVGYTINNQSDYDKYKKDYDNLMVNTSVH
jgi:glycerophosphoryl diester phosphodiesterase